MPQEKDARVRNPDESSEGAPAALVKSASEIEDDAAQLDRATKAFDKADK